MMSLSGAKKQEPLKEVLKRAKENFERKMTISGSSAVSSSNIGEVLARHHEITGQLPTDPDGTATTLEINREELGSYLGGEKAVTLPREAFNQAVRIHNREVREAGHPSQMMEPVLPVNADEDRNRLGQVKVNTISSDDGSSLSPPPTMNYGGSEIFFPSQTPRERVVSPLPATDYSERSLLGLPPRAITQDPFSTPRASAGIIACRYIQSEENTSQNDEKEGGMEETRQVYTPILRKFEISDGSDNEDDMVTEVEWRDEEPYMTPTKKGKKRNKGKGVKRPVTPERPSILNMPQTPRRKRLEADWAKPAESLANENEQADLGKIIGEYLRNTNGLRDFMVGQERNDANYDISCQQQSQYIVARQNHTEAAVMSVREIAQKACTEVEMEREYAAERAEKLNDRLSKMEKRLAKIAPVNMAKTIENAMKSCMEGMIDQLTDRVVKRFEDAAEEV